MKNNLIPFSLLLLEKWNSCTSIVPNTCARCTVKEAAATAYRSNKECKPKRTSKENTEISRKARKRDVANANTYIYIHTHSSGQPTPGSHHASEQ